MFRSEISKMPVVLIMVCLGGLTLASCSISNQAVSKESPSPTVQEAASDKKPLLSNQTASVQPATNRQTDTRVKEPAAISAPPALPPAPHAAEAPKRGEGTAKPGGAVDASAGPFLSAAPPRKNENIKKPSADNPVVAPPQEERRLREEEKLKKPPARNPVPANPRDERRAREEEKERDVMEEALLLLDEAQRYWVKGELEDALQMLDQAYALLLDTNGNPDIVRQKDDLRLMISKRILTIYNSYQTGGKVKRGEIPIVTNAEVEKEIRLFQTVERNFFISSYQRSMIYRPLIVRELAKAGLPEELSWLPLVESGYKITALSSARALGLWQFIPSTGYKYGLNRDDWVDERMDVEKSTRAAIDYFKDLHAMFGDWLTVLAGYNCGEGRVMRTITSQHINYLDRFWDLYSRLPNETARYVPRFLATLLIVRDPQKYGIDLGPGDSKIDILSYEVVEINRSMRLQDIAQKLETSEETIQILNAELRHRMTPDRPYSLKVPLAKSELLLKVLAEIPLGEKLRTTHQTVRGVVITHKVRQGETLASIAEKYRASPEAIRSANRLSKKPLTAGQRLNVPIRSTKASGPAEKESRPAKTASHRVQKGDTLSSLSKKYQIPVAELRTINGLKGEVLKVGQTIIITKGIQEEAPPAERKKTGPAVKKEKAKPAAGKAVPAKVPETAAPKRYTVKKGDSLHRIARENNTTLEELFKLNGMGQQTNIQPGQVILVR